MIVTDHSIEEFYWMYYTYILTNPSKTCLYVGVTNDLKSRLEEHRENRGKAHSHAGKYYCYKLLYYEEHKYILDAIAREKEIKLFTHAKKIELVKTQNPTMGFIQFKSKNNAAFSRRKRKLKINNQFARRLNDQ